MTNDELSTLVDLQRRLIDALGKSKGASTMEVIRAKDAIQQFEDSLECNQTTFAVEFTEYGLTYATAGNEAEARKIAIANASATLGVNLTDADILRVKAEL